MRLFEQKFLLTFFSSVNVNAFRLGDANISLSVLAAERLPGTLFPLSALIRLEEAEI